MRSKWSVLRVWLMMVCVLAIAGGLATPAAPAQASDENNVRQDDKQDEKKEEKKDEKKGLTLKPDAKLNSRLTKAHGSRWTFRPTERPSSSNCSATSIRFRSRAARPSRSPRAWPSTASRATRRTDNGLPSSPTATARTTCTS